MCGYREIRRVRCAGAAVFKGALAGVLGVALLAAVFWVSSGTPTAMPELILTRTDGAPLDLTALQGEPVLVTFWATSCPTCVREMPELARLYRELRHTGFEIIGIAMPYDPPHWVVRMIADQATPYPIVFDPEGHAVAAFSRLVADTIHLTPTSLLIAPDGSVVLYTVGKLDIPALKKTIVNLLPERPESI